MRVDWLVVSRMRCRALPCFAVCCGRGGRWLMLLGDVPFTSRCERFLPAFKGVRGNDCNTRKPKSKICVLWGGEGGDSFTEIPAFYSEAFLLRRGHVRETPGYMKLCVNTIWAWRPPRGGGHHDFTPRPPGLSSEAVSMHIPNILLEQPFVVNTNSTIWG